MLRAYSLKPKKRGQTTCNQCLKGYPNNVVPKHCSCGCILNGTYEATVQTKTNHAIKVGKLVSVRLHGQGINVRTFVSTEDNKVLVLDYFKLN